MRLDLATPARILFGPGCASELGAAVASMGRRPLWVTGSSGLERTGKLAANLPAGLRFQVPAEPDTSMIMAGLTLARRERCDVVIGLGGGSVIDAAKAMAGLLPHESALLDHLEVVGKGQPLPGPGAPFIAVPTTAGAGAEVTRNAVLASPQHRVKASIRSHHLLARLAVVDPELTYSLPPSLTAATGMDALTQLIEPWVSTRANPVTDGFCWEGMGRVARSLRGAFAAGTDAHAREDMALAALLGGLAHANAGLGAVHGFAAPLGGMFSAPHGAICAVLLPHAMRVNIAALRARAPDSPALPRYQEAARRLTGNANASHEDGVGWVETLCQDLAIPPLRSYKIAEADLEVIAEKAAQASSMKANPIELTAEERRQILRLAY